MSGQITWSIGAKRCSHKWVDDKPQEARRGITIFILLTTNLIIPIMITINSIDKVFYEAPTTFVVEVKAEGIIRESSYDGGGVD